MKKKIITISREYGSGGHNVGKALAERLGYTYYDREIITHIAEQTAFSESFIEEHGEYSKGSSLFAGLFGGEFISERSINNYLFEVQRKMIMDLAEKGDCVIVGRCADFYLRNRKDALHIFVYGEAEDKIQRTMMKEKLDHDKAAARIRQMDKNRALNYRYVADEKWGSRENYDLMLNTSTLGLDGCVDLLEDLARRP